MAKVFISHRRSDVVPAEKLATRLRDAGHTVWFDEWEIDVGDSIVGRMDEGLRDAGHVVLCLSESGVDAPYISREWLSTVARQLSGQGVRLLPARLTGGEPPAILADLRYADLVEDWDTGVREILRALER
jgi:hypothetical protein